MERRLSQFFAKLAPEIARQAYDLLASLFHHAGRRMGAVRDRVDHQALAKAPLDEPTADQQQAPLPADVDAILAAINLGDWADVAEIYADLADLYGDGYVRGLQLLIAMTGAPAPPAGEAGFGISLDQANEASIAWARQHAAERVTLIRDDTRDMLRATVTQAIEEGWGAARLATELRDSAGFNAARSGLIARTEVLTANNRGNFDSYRASGVVTGKEWVTAGDDLVDEEICQANEDAGPIGLDEVFPSGDDSPPGHPRCRCALLPTTEPL
jgi:Phage Mu protein F like protein